MILNGELSCSRSRALADPRIRARACLRVSKASTRERGSRRKDFKRTGVNEARSSYIASIRWTKVRETDESDLRRERRDPRSLGYIFFSAPPRLKRTRFEGCGSKNLNLTQFRVITAARSLIHPLYIHPLIGLHCRCLTVSCASDRLGGYHCAR